VVGGRGGRVLYRVWINNNKKMNFPRFKEKLFLSYIHNPKNAEGKNSNNKNILSPFIVFYHQI
jgi:hypothetical protein